jgi:hypothetical protein
MVRLNVIGDGETPHLGADAICTDDQIVAALGSVGELRDHAVIDLN